MCSKVITEGRDGEVTMVAGTGDKKVDWQLIRDVAKDLRDSGTYGVVDQFNNILHSYDEVNIRPDAWSRVGQLMMTGPYDSAARQIKANLTRGKEMLELIAGGLDETAKVWETCEGKNIDNLTPDYAPPYNNSAGKID
jgi:hypothetical protein